MQLLDYAYSYDGHILFNFGVEGVSFNWVNGLPKYTDVVMKNPQYLSVGGHGPLLPLQLRRPVRPGLPLLRAVPGLSGAGGCGYSLVDADPREADAAGHARRQTSPRNTPPSCRTSRRCSSSRLPRRSPAQSPVADWDKTVAQLKHLWHRQGRSPCARLRSTATKALDVRQTSEVSQTSEVCVPATGETPEVSKTSGVCIGLTGEREQAHGCCRTSHRRSSDRHPRSIGHAPIAHRVAKDFARNKYIYLMLAPVVGYYLIFYYGPMYGAQIAFRDFEPALGITGSEWVGWQNFKEFFTSPFFPGSFATQ